MIYGEEIMRWLFVNINFMIRTDNWHGVIVPSLFSESWNSAGTGLSDTNSALGNSHGRYNSVT